MDRQKIFGYFTFLVLGMGLCFLGIKLGPRLIGYVTLNFPDHAKSGSLTPEKVAELSKASSPLEQGQRPAKSQHISVQMLISSSGSGGHPIVKAVLAKDLETLKSLLKGSLSDTASKYALGSAVKVATLLGDVKSTMVLIDGGALNYVTGVGSQLTPLHIAASEGQIEILKLLLSKGLGTVPSYAEESPLMLASKNGQIAALNVLLQNKVDINFVDRFKTNALWHAAANGQKEAVKVLLEAGVDPVTTNSYSGNTIEVAAAEGYRDVVDLIMGKVMSGKPLQDIEAAAEKAMLIGAAPAKLDEAIRQNNFDLVKELLNLKSEISNYKFKANGPLYQSVEKGNVEIAKLLISKGADVNGKTERGTSAPPLSAAIKMRRLDLIDFLVQNGADPNYKYSSSDTPLLILAIKEKDVRTAERLLKLGANPDIADWTGTPALGFAINDNHLEMVNVLIDNKANLNLPDRYGSLLHRAVIFNRIDIAQVLVQRGISTSSRDHQGKTAREIASEKKQTQMLTVLPEIKTK